MEYQFLQEAPPPTGSRLGPTESQLISVALHLLLFFLILYVPGHLPPRLRALLEPAPPPAVPIAAVSPQPLLQPARPPAKLHRPPPQKIPLGFAYVKVPDDTPSPTKNPNAPLMSDRNRVARQEVPTPPDAKKFTIDPHSQGNTETRVRPDPRLKEGPENPETPRPGSEARRESGEPGSGERAGGANPGDEARPTIGDPVLGGTRPPGGASGSGPAGPGLPGTGYIPSEEAREKVQQILADARSTEHKDTFMNQGYLASGSSGAMSFDTQDFPWGDYQRRVYMAIRNNWFARIPLAARQGMRGYVCWHFTIEKDGSVSEVQSVRSSSVPPLDRAADDAIRASSRLPPLPEGFPKPREGATYCFFYNMLPSEAE